MAASSPSALLQQRLQQQQKRTAHSLPPDAQPAQPSRRLTPGRDDAIFDTPDSPPQQQQQQRHSSARLFQSSPVTSHARRSSHMTATTAAPSSSSGTRSMGAREMEGYADKLSKQNFDLKLEVYHRREKIDELERRLLELPQLRDDNAELIDINHGLMNELDKRDRAVDEAVVMICDLEERVRLLQSRLRDQSAPLDQALDQPQPQPRPTTAEDPPRTARQHSSQPTMASPPSPPGLATPPRRQRRRSNSADAAAAAFRRAVSSDPNTSKRSSGDAPADPVAVPSFIDHQSATTSALRSLYVEQGRRVRTIPSRASLLSASVANEDDAPVDDLLKSPAMSVLSESEFKSLYGDRKSDSPEDRPRERVPEPESPVYNSARAETARLARTNRWVNDRAVSPALVRPRPMRHVTSPPFQSLTSVLTEDEPSSPEKKPAKNLRAGWDDGAMPALRHNASFGHANFPPTPDTMLTHPSTHSSASIIRERSSHDVAVAPTKVFAPALPESLAGDLHAPSADFMARGSFLPREVDAYGSDSDEDYTTASAQPGLGVSLFQSDGHGSEAAAGERRSLTYSGAFMPNLFDMHSGRPSTATRGAVDTPRAHRPSDEFAPVPRAHQRSSSATPTQPLYLRRPHSDYEPLPASFSLAAVTPVRKPPTPPPHADGSFARPSLNAEWRPSTPRASAATGEEAQATAAASAPSRADLIRQRVAKFGRRGTANTPTDEGSSSTPSHRHTGSLGRRTRQFFRRNSGTAHQPPSPRSPRTPTAARRAVVASGGDGDGDEGARRAAFLSAAQAASPYLDALGAGKPLPGLPKGVGAGAATAGNPFPRRDRNGEDVDA